MGENKVGSAVGARQDRLGNGEAESQSLAL